MTTTGTAVLVTAFVLLFVTLAYAAPQSVSGPMSVAATHPQSVRNIDDLVDRMISHGDLRIVRVVHDPLVPGRSHERLHQMWEGLRVLGADMTRQRDGRQTRSAFGVLYPDMELDPTPTLSPEDATASVYGGQQTALGPTPELVIFHDADSASYRLVYRVHRFVHSGLIVSLVDAQTGALVHTYNDVRTQTAQLPCTSCAVGSGLGVKGDKKKMSVTVSGGVFRANDALRPPAIVTYDMKGDWRRTIDVLTGGVQLLGSDLAANTDNDWRDGASVDAHTGTGWFSDYLFDRFGRRGLDGLDGPIVSQVHPVRRSDVFRVPTDIRNLFHLNAFFCGACGPYGTMVYGEGLPPGLVLESTGQSVDFFAAALDVVGHELAHAVTAFTSQLIYQGESGALSEAFSDLLGVGIEFFIAETGRHLAEQPDYIVGEDVLKPGGIRSLADPQSRGDPDHYSKRFTGTADNGGVHTNSLIVTHAYYLAIEGGTNRTSGLPVIGVGSDSRDQVEQVFYRAFAFLLPAGATFAMARAATIQSARDLTGGVGGSLEQTIAAAWSAVGVE